MSRREQGRRGSVAQLNEKDGRISSSKIKGYCYGISLHYGELDIAYSFFRCSWIGKREYRLIIVLNIFFSLSL